MRRLFICMSLCVGVSLSGCSHSPAGTDNLGAFFSLMNQDFMTDQSETESRILDRRLAISSDAFRGYWLYSQLNTGEDQSLYRQRVHHFTQRDDGAIVQSSYSLKQPEDVADLWDKPKMVRALSPDDLEPFANAGCRQIWTKDGQGGWMGKVDPDTCIIESKRRNKSIRIGSDSQVTTDRYFTSERGFELDGTLLWGTPEGEMIPLRRVD